MGKDAGAVAGVAGFRAEPLLTKVVVNAHIVFKLPGGVSILGRRVRNGEMRIHAAHMQVGKAADALRGFRSLHTVFRALRKQARTGHSGIELNVHIHGDTCGPRGFAELLGGRFIHHRLRHGMRCKLACVFRARVTQNEDRLRDAARAQVKRLLQTGHGKCIRAMALQKAPAAHGAMAVCIRLDDAHDLFAGAPCNVEVVQQCIKIDFRPSAGVRRKRVHSASKNAWAYAHISMIYYSTSGGWIQFTVLARC